MDRLRDRWAAALRRRTLIPVPQLVLCLSAIALLIVPAAAQADNHPILPPLPKEIWGNIIVIASPGVLCGEPLPPYLRVPPELTAGGDPTPGGTISVAHYGEWVNCSQEGRFELGSQGLRNGIGFGYNPYPYAIQGGDVGTTFEVQVQGCNEHGCSPAYPPADPRGNAIVVQSDPTPPPPPPPPPGTTQCNDSQDNDSDGTTDMNDRSCDSPSDNDEWSDPACEFGCTGSSSFAHFYLLIADVSPLLGTRAYIKVPLFGDVSAAEPHCLVGRSDAEDGTSYLIQTGWIRCFQGATLRFYNCGASGGIEYYVERRTPAGGYQCFPQGTADAGTRHRFSVSNTSQSGVRWRAYIDGVDKQVVLDGMRSARGIVEGGEYTGSPRAAWTFKSTWDTWQRWNGSNWVRIQYPRDPYIANRWRISGRPPDPFTITH